MIRFQSTKLMRLNLWWMVSAGLLLLSIVLQSPAESAPTEVITASGETGAFRVLHSDAERVAFEVIFPQINRIPIEVDGDIYEQITMDGHDQQRNPGRPDLPEESFVVALPPGAVASVSILEQEHTVLDGVKVAPVSWQDLVQFEGIAAGVEPVFEEKFEFDPLVYGESVLYPTAAATLGNTFWLRDQRAVPVIVYPVQTNPVEQTLTTHNRMVVEVTFTYPEGRGALSTPRVESVDYEQALQTTLINYQESRDWREVRESQAAPQTSPCLADWNPNTFRIQVENTGVHQVTYAELAAAGLSGTTSSNRIQMCHVDEEIAILVEDGGDGTFGSGDRVVFYGETIKTQETETNIYWLTVDPDELGLRIQSQSGVPNAATIPAFYIDTKHLEQDNVYYNAFPTADLNDHWYWAAISYQLDVPATLDVPFSVNNLEPGSYMVTIRAEVWGFSTVDDHRYRILLNGTQVGPDQYFYGSGKDTFHLFNVQVASSQLLNGNNTLRIEALPDGGSDPRHKMLVNWFEVDYRRRHVDENDRLVFTQATTGTWRYSVTNFAAAPDIFDVTDPHVPVKVTGATGTNPVLFERTNNAAATFALSTAAARYSVVGITKDSFPNPRLQSTTNQADYIIITDPSFASTLTPLINRRTSVDGFTVRTVYVQDIFDEFGYGFYDTEAIRRFLEYTYADWTAPAPSYVLLVGEGSYDHRNLLGLNGTGGNLMPVYLKSGVDSWLGETAADNQYVEFTGDGLAEMMLGRLPVRNTTELNTMINKIITYETQPLTLPWHANHLFVTDNGKVYNSAAGQCEIDPAGDFFQTVNSFINDEFPLGRQFANFIYYAPTQCYPPPRPGEYAGSALEVQTRFQDALNQGQNFVVYTGHSGVDFWAGGPQLITTNNIANLTNGNRTPIMLPMTCLEGFYHTPELNGFAETIVRHNGGGAVASYSPTGLQVQTGHGYLLTGFYEAVFDLDVLRIGQAVRNAKQVLYDSNNNNVQDLHDTYMLLGDPAMRLHVWEATSAVSLPLMIK